MQRSQLKVTLEKARRHVGVETQRQWSEAAILRTTSALLGLFSLVASLARRRRAGPARATWQAARYRKECITFAVALTFVRREQWRHDGFQTPTGADGSVKLPRAFVELLTEALRYVA